MNKKLMSVLLFVMTGTVMAQEATVTPLTSKDLKELPGKEVVGRNASSTKPAKFLVFFIKDKGAPILVPAPTETASQPKGSH